MQQLITWQQEQAGKEHLEPYMVLQFNTIKEIARLQPKTSSDLLRIKGIGPAKIRKYGDVILGLVRGNGITGDVSVAYETKNNLFAEAQAVNDLAAIRPMPVQQPMHYDQETGEIIDKNDVAVSVTDFVTMLDTLLQTHFRNVRVQGEVVGFKRNASGHVYFEIKDRSSVMRCMIFCDRYDLAGVALADGMEIVITGHPNYHKQYGFSFVGTMVELYGEGALKKAYDDLKKKLDAEGLLALEKKRALPQLPQRVGLITSRTGAAIGDFTTNVGHYGYKIIFHQSRVEGAQAVDDLISALTTMAKKDLDVLVIVRGGGSLESLQAFNNEKVVRMVADFPVPVVAGVGHEQDETLTTLVADRGVSTPTAAARAVRESWDQCGEYVRSREQMIVHFFDKALRQQQERGNEYERQLTDFLEEIVTSSLELFRRFANVIHHMEKSIDRKKTFFTVAQDHIFRFYGRMIDDARTLVNMQRAFALFQSGIIQYMKRLQFLAKSIVQNDPQRQLMLGYSIARDERGNVVRRKNDVSKGDHMTIHISDGEIMTEVQ
ncbi:MAG: exodeoxyribonuclease VII large subunit [Parcubacteria group bacterium]|jgi:exodeoxyribonuclease VII large subunit